MKSSDLHPDLTHYSFDPHVLAPKTASQLVHPFLHCSLVWPNRLINACGCEWSVLCWFPSNTWFFFVSQPPPPNVLYKYSSFPFLSLVFCRCWQVSDQTKQVQRIITRWFPVAFLTGDPCPICRGVLCTVTNRLSAPKYKPYLNQITLNSAECI